MNILEESVLYGTTIVLIISVFILAMAVSGLKDNMAETVEETVEIHHIYLVESLDSVEAGEETLMSLMESAGE